MLSQSSSSKSEASGQLICECDSKEDALCHTMQELANTMTDMPLVKNCLIHCDEEK